MAKIKIILLFIAFVMLSACANNPVIVPSPTNVTTPSVIEADKAREMGIAWFREGDYNNAGNYFAMAADIYSSNGKTTEEKLLVTAAAQSYLKYSMRDEFKMMAARLKGLFGRWTMPTDDQKILINIAARMNEEPLPYPVKANWRNIFE